MQQDQQTLEAEIERQNASLAETIEAVRDLPLDTELAVSSEWLEAIDEMVAPRSTTPTVVNSSMRC